MAGTVPNIQDSSATPVAPSVTPVVPVVNSTPWYLSKTVWLNVLVLVAALAGALSQAITAGEALSVLAVLNILIRVVTNTPLSWK